MNKLQIFIRKLQIKMQLRLITKAIYSDKYSIANEDDRENFINKYVSEDDSIGIIITSLVIKHIYENNKNRISDLAEFSEPSKKLTVLEILIETLENLEGLNLKDKLSQNLLKAKSNLCKVKAKWHLALMNGYLDVGRTAFQKDDLYSYEAFRYYYEMSNKKPLLKQEEERFKQILKESKEKQMNQNSIGGYQS